MLTGKVCVINGAASTIGRAVAERFAREGGVVVGVDRAEHSVGEHVVQADLVDEAEVQSMYEDVVRRYGRLDVIYNNMGLMDRGDHSALDTSLETWRRVHDANLTSIFLCCKLGIPHLRNTEPAGGSVINSASFLAAMGSATAPMAYAAAKAGVVQLTRDLGVQLARSGVRVNAVLFGPIETPDQRAVFDRNPGALEKRLVHWPMGRFGTLEEAAGAIAFLASDDSGFITAAALPLDGGITEAFTVPELRPSRVRSQYPQRGLPVRAARLEPRLAGIKPLRRHPAEHSGRPAYRGLRLGRAERPGIAVRSRQLAAHLRGRLARPDQRVGECPVGQPGDVPQPFRVGQVDAELAGDVEAMSPVLREPGCRQRGRLHWPGHPFQRPPGIGGQQCGHRGLPRLPPAREDHCRCCPLGLHPLGGTVVNRAAGHRADTLRHATGSAADDTFLGLGEVQDHIGHRPAGRGRLR
jgi:NAD(P)-dependent dehydrogenase (short-subunit alcohol dehydrogenase family)